MDKVTFKQFRSFIQFFDGEELETPVQKKPFRVDVAETYISFTPEVSGESRSVYYKNDIIGSEGKKGYLAFYNEGCRQGKDFPRKNYMDVSYFIAVMKEYEKPQNRIFHKSENHKKTETQSLAMARVGQGEFRNQLLAYWESSCSVTGVNDKNLLRASHIKPWRDSQNNERLDKFNGLLLNPNLDLLFDKGFITFDGNGKIHISKQISKKNLDRLGVKDSMSLRRIDGGHKHFLDYHREKVFQK